MLDSSPTQLHPLPNRTRVCLTLPPKVHSCGLWKSLAFPETHNWFSYSLPKGELIISVMFIITQVSHYFLKNLGLPLFISQLLAGLMLSPALLGEALSRKFITDNIVQALGTFGSLGYGCFLYLCGVKMDPSMVIRVSKRAFYIGFLAVIPSTLVALTILRTFLVDYQDKAKALTLIPGYNVTTYPVITSILSDLKLLNTELGRIVQTSAIVSDACGVIVFLIISFSKATLQEAIRDVIAIIFFTTFVFLVLRPSIELVLKHTPEGKPVDQIYITILIFLYLVSASLPKWFSRFRFIASYILGLGIPHGPPIGSALVEKLESMVNHLLLPTFIATAGMRVEKLVIGFHSNLEIINAFNVLIALLVKFVACLLPPLYNNMPLKDTIALALLMCTKGIVELAGNNFYNDQKIISKDHFTFMFYVIMFTASIVPILVKALYDPSRKYAGYQKRNLIASKPDAELSIVACIHRPENVRAIINLLDVACPSKESPMSVNVLHLIKLKGESAPVFISHQKKRRVYSKYCSYYENIIIFFNKFEGANWGAVSVDSFSSITPPNLMHDDICTLALDKQASLIILPFHRRWYIDGSIESDDHSIRVLNSRVLEKSPCSVGILIDRSNIRRSAWNPLAGQEHNVAMVFLGGPDDREALTFVKRMAGNPKMRITVLHMVAQQNNKYEDWGTMVDNVILRDFTNKRCVTYIKKEVNDGPETATILRSFINEFNVIIVGRGDNWDLPQTSGLKQWSEFPELGVLGDLLASSDFDGKCSVLVVRQQLTTE